MSTKEMEEELETSPPHTMQALKRREPSLDQPKAKETESEVDVARATMIT